MSGGTGVKDGFYDLSFREKKKKVNFMSCTSQNHVSLSIRTVQDHQTESCLDPFGLFLSSHWRPLLYPQNVVTARGIYGPVRPSPTVGRTSVLTVGPRRGSSKTSERSNLFVFVLIRPSVR